MTFSASTANQDTLRRFVIDIAQLLADRHCEDVRILDVRGLSQVCDYILLATGTSDRQMKSLAEELQEVAEQSGQAVFRSSRDTNLTWIVVDFVDVVAHLFEPAQREYYDLESLWSDAPEVPWQRTTHAR